MLRCSPKDWRHMRKPKKDSHKGDNGRLLICAGSKQYHGSLVLAIRAAVRFCDLVYVYSPDNEALTRKLKLSTPNIIVLASARSLVKFMPRIDAVLAGSGWEESKKNRTLLSLLLKTKKPIALDAGAFGVLDKRMLHENVLLTPHRGEFMKLFGIKATAASVLAMAKKTGATILCKGHIDFISDGKHVCSNRIHDVGMTKGGSGDVLAGLCAALMADHNKPMRAACASAYLLGSCGLRLSKKMGTHYSSWDLVEELPLAAHTAEK
ncbi:ADP-dependent (S)-NAD(P)H-hydrate dehydratase [uncultured archaeon]|nr:ADP-dependent (S)-NAD(P)H-hydrate dehydratase [uncultured archaeon]